MSSRFSLCAAAMAVAFSLAATPAVAQTPAAPVTLQASLASDIGNLSDKFSGLAQAMSGKYDWRPMAGVRSVADVLNLIVGENRMLAGLLGAPAAPAAGGNAAITDPAALQAAIKSTYATLRGAVEKLSASDLNAPATIFGRQTTKQGALLIVLLDQHEHLGQSIAYARSNSVVPPWSK